MTEATDLRAWLPYRRSLPGPAPRLLCFPHAGGTAATFVPWSEALGDDVDVCAVQLPGRQGRLHEPALTRMEEVVKTVVPVVRSLSDAPYALFGVSLGGLVAFELARALSGQDVRPPSRLMVAGCAAPTAAARRGGELHRSSDAELIEHLRTYEGTPPEVLGNAEIMGILLGFIRADFALSELYESVPGAPLDLPIDVFSGKGDHIAHDGAEAWKTETSGPVEFHEAPGGHLLAQPLEALIHDAVRSWAREVQGTPWRS